MSTQRFTPEFKAEAVRQVIERGYSVAETAERLGVSTHSLYKWVKAVTPDKTEKQAIKSPAPVRFIHAAVVTRAMPKLPCQEGKCSTNTLPAGWYFLRDGAVAKLPNP